jgi:hypothetical protein
MRECVTSGIRPSFPGLSQSQGQVTHVLLTRSPLEYPQRGLSARLACVKHAASVRPEPGSNSPSRPHRHTKPQQRSPTCQDQGKSNPSTTPHTHKRRRHIPKEIPTTNPNKQGPWHEDKKKALAFNTLLSSQKTDTTEDPTTGPHRGNPSSLPGSSTLSSGSIEPGLIRIWPGPPNKHPGGTKPLGVIRSVVSHGPATLRRPASRPG